MLSRRKKKVHRPNNKTMLLADLISIFKDRGANGLSIEEIEQALPNYTPRRTLQRRLTEMQRDIIVAKGGARSTRYFSVASEKNRQASIDAAMDIDWVHISEPHKIDSPALLIYPERVRHNIQKAIEMAGSPDNLRPHVKTNKSPDAVRLMQQYGINKFKCATISETEMLGIEKAKDVLFAYQPVGPKLERFISLIKKYPETKYSCLVDNMQVAEQYVSAFSGSGVVASLYVDLNVGMNRSGIKPGPGALRLLKYLFGETVIQSVGLHIYDGHIVSASLQSREKEINKYFGQVNELLKEMENQGMLVQTIIGGSPAFPVHAKQNKGECSPGTFIYWDKSYLDLYPEQQFLPAALVLCRVVSIPGDNLITVDLGHKSIASENEITRRVFFLGQNDLVPVSHSEEHLVLKNNGTKVYAPGDILYGIPYHVCPTVALYEKSFTVESGQITGEWINSARDRRIEV